MWKKLKKSKVYPNLLFFYVWIFYVQKYLFINSQSHLLSLQLFLGLTYFLMKKQSNQKSSTNLKEQQGSFQKVPSQNSQTPRSSTDSPRQIMKDNIIERLKQKILVEHNIKYAAAFAMLTIAIIYFAFYGQYVITPNILENKFTDAQYQYQVYCPINKALSTQGQGIANFVSLLTMASHQAISILEDQQLRLRRMLTEQVEKAEQKNIDKYLIFIKMGNLLQLNQKTNKQQNKTQFFYCSYVTDWKNRHDCSNAYPLCTSPGPMFYVQKDQPIDVAWIYNMNYSNNFTITNPNPGKQSCYQVQDSEMEKHCKIYKRINSQTCTYEDPTQILKSQYYKENSYQINSTNIPFTVHVHGLQVRPTFDGNPLSWMGRDGAQGIGFYSIQSKDKSNIYYQQFENKTQTSLVSYGFLQKFVQTAVSALVGNTSLFNPSKQYFYKINRYENFQPPGNLWYHDHSMHVTRDNVELGLAGNYIIYDRKNCDAADKGVDCVLPTGDQQFFIISNRGDDIKRPQTQHNGGIYINPIGQFKTSNPPQFKRNTNYRIRFLNGNFDSYFTDISFVTDCKCKDLSNCSYLSNCTIKQFAIIGTDSSLFNSPINATKFSLASSQRVEIIIQFEKNITSNYVLLISGQGASGAALRTKFQLLNQTGNDNQLITPQVNQTLKKLPFTNFTNYTQCKQDHFLNSSNDPTSCIYRSRMRPLFADSKFKFHFNGHYKFSQSGKSDNPIIGTTQDWFLINTMWFDHPIHIHLINYQLIDAAQLRVFNNTNCPYYAMDFWVNTSVISKFRCKNIIENACDKCLLDCDCSGCEATSDPRNYSDICNLMLNKLKISDEKAQNKVDSNELFDQDNFTKTSDKRLISGQDIYQKYDNQDYSTSNCPNYTDYKYICDDFKSIQAQQFSYLKRWKEVALIPAFKVYRVRIRWASVDYNHSVNPYPYFKVPEDQLIEFPGYVYHCHFLHHEDNQLMRPFMMQPSKQWRSKNPKQHKQWKDKYEQINNHMGCQKKDKKTASNYNRKL